MENHIKIHLGVPQLGNRHMAPERNGLDGHGPPWHLRWEESKGFGGWSAPDSGEEGRPLSHLGESGFFWGALVFSFLGKYEHQ